MALSFLAAAAACGDAAAQWDLSTVINAGATWADNVDYSRARGRARDPNNPGPAREPDGDVISFIQLRGLARFTGRRLRFSGSYEPRGALYRDRTDLNRLSHTGRLQAGWDMTRRTILNVTDRFTYSPDQGARADDISSPVIITDFTDRRTNLVQATLETSLTPRSTLSYGLENGFQAFSDPDLADSNRTGATVEWSRQVGTRSSFELGGRASTNRFRQRLYFDDDGDPNTPEAPRTVGNRSQVYNATAGGTLGLGATTTATSRLGYDWVSAERDELAGLGAGTNNQNLQFNSTSFHADASLSWQTRVLNALVGYNQSLRTGSGVFAVSRTKSAFANLRAALGSRVTGMIFANQSWTSSAASRTGGTITTISGGASVDVMFSRAISGRVQVSSNAQNSGARRSSDIDFNRVSVGLVARID